MNVSTVIKIILAIVVLYWLAHIVMSLFGLVFVLAFFVGLAVLLVWAWKFVKFALFGLAGETSDAAQSGANYKLWEADGSISLFAQEPQLADLAQQRLLEDKGAVIKLPNNARVKVLSDADKEAVKVKVLDGHAKGKTGWVARSALIKET